MCADSSGPSIARTTAGRTAPAAKDWLEATDLARPLHIFEGVCNLVNTQGQVVSLMLAPAEMTPLSIEVVAAHTLEGFPDAVQPQDEVHIENPLLYIGRFVLETGTMSIWPPMPDWDSARLSSGEWNGMLTALEARLIGNHSPEGAAVLLVNKAGPPWLQRARAPIEQLLHGVELLDVELVQAGAHDLAGLGPGLTPSGDDFIIGVIYGLWATVDPADHFRIITGMLSAAQERTNALSANYLSRAAKGEASEPWHALVQALIQGDEQGLLAPVDSLIGLGHTSGQDALTGFLLGAACFGHRS